MKRNLVHSLVVSSLMLLGSSQVYESTAMAAGYPQTELRAVETKDERTLRELRDQEVNQLRIALGRRLPNHRKAELYFRLAEIYVEAYHAAFLMEGKVHERRLEKKVTDKLIDRASSLPFLGLAIKACDELIRLKISYSKMDQVYYFLGFANSELGKRKESIRYFEALVSKYPQSNFSGEAYRELADAAFSDTKYRKAITNYELSLKKGGDLQAPRTLHKLAWAYYRTKQFDLAVSTLKNAISLSQKGGEKYLSLKEEALRDMAIFMTETGKVDEAVEYFQKSAGDSAYYARVLERLGKQYERNLEFGRAVQVYESLLKTAGYDSSAGFRVLVKLVDLELRQGKLQQALGRLKFVKWPAESDKDSETLAAAQNLRAMIRRTATEHHEKFRKKHKRADLEIAESFYTGYDTYILAHSDPRSEKPEIAMYLAEVKRDLGKSKEASELYRKVLESKDKRYAKEAGALWTASLTETMKKTAEGGGGIKQGEPSAVEKEFVEAADRLQNSLGNTNEAREASLRAAQVFAGYKGTQKEAASRLREVMKRWEKSPQALVAARLLIQMVSDQVQGNVATGDAADDLKEVIQEIRQMPGLLAADHESGGDKVKSAILEQEIRVKLGTIAKEEKSKDFVDAAKGYENLAAESTQKEFAEKVYENAISAYFKAADYEGVDRVTSNWLKRFPKSSKAIESTKNTASFYLIVGRFDVASRLFERLGREMGDVKALETAARIEEGLGNIAKSQVLLSNTIELYPQSANRFKVAFNLAESFETAGKDSDAAKTYRYCMAGGDQLQALCGIRLADMYLRDKDRDQALKTFKIIAALGKKKNESNATGAAIGYARYRLAEDLEKNAHFIPLQLPEQNLKKAMNQRLDFLESLGRAYSAATDAGGPWGVTGLTRLAYWVLRFSSEIDTIPTPANAPAEAIAKFRKNLEAVSLPLRRKAVNTWVDAYSKAVAGEVLSPTLPDLVDRLVEYKVKDMERAQGVRGHFRLGGLAPDGGVAGREDALKAVRAKLVQNPQDANAWIDYGNLLWGQAKPFLAEIAYERAMVLGPQNPAAFNNRAVLEMSGEREDEWLKVAEAYGLLQDALKKDSFYLTAKFNKALVLNYYRLYAKAKPLWEQVLHKEAAIDAQDGLAIAQQGMGDSKGAESSFSKANDLGAKDSRPTFLFHKAARIVAGAPTPEALKECASVIGDLDKDVNLGGFEKAAWSSLKQICMPAPVATNESEKGKK